MPGGRQGKGKGQRTGGVAAEKKKERAVRQALRRERQGGAYLKPSDPDFKSFSNQLAVQGLRLQDVPGDGNCLFRALAQQLGDRLVTHHTLRRDVVQFMRQHPEQFEPFVAEGDCCDSYDDYSAKRVAISTSTLAEFKFQTGYFPAVSSLIRDGEYAGNDAIVAFTRAFSAHVVIHQLNSPRWEIRDPPTATPTTLKHQTLHIAYLNGDHYCSVLPITTINPLPKIKSLPLTECSHEGCTHGVGRGGTEVEGKRGGSSSQLQRVMVATRCENPTLAEQVLSENAYDVDLAIVELLQLMDLGQDLATGDGTASDGRQKTSTKKKTYQPLPKRHLSNRERKAQAKMDRKERRREEQGARAKTASTFDPVGAMAI